MSDLAPIPDIIIRRLPIYLQALQHLHSRSIVTTNSQELGKMLGISAAQIRKDLSQFGGFGKQGTGYNIPFLIEKLKNILKIDRTWDVILVGAGDLGHAIARYQGFQNRGFRIIAVFDNNTAIIGSTIEEFSILPVSQARDFIQKNRVNIALLTVPASSAQEAAEFLVEAGIKAILNYAPISLLLPEGIQVEYLDPLLQLQHMTYYLE